MQQLESFVLEQMARTALPGLCLSLVQGERVTHRSFGFKDLQARTVPTPETLFGLGSITKVFTALAVMQLCDEGRLSLDDPLGDYLDSELAPMGKPVLIKHLLSHSSGVPALGYSESKMSERWWMHGYPVNSVEDLLRFMQDANDWAQAQPGERWFYLNEGYILLGAIIERVSGKPYVTYIKEHILKPLGMQQSFFSEHAVAEHKNAATPYMKARDGSFFVGSNLYGNIQAAGGLVSTAANMTRFAQMLLAEGANIISKASFTHMTRPFVAMPAENAPLFEDATTTTQSNFFGLGLQVQQDFFDHTVIAHGGGVMGGTTYLAAIPEQQTAVIVLANAHGYPLSHIALASLATLLGHDYKQLEFVRLEACFQALQGEYVAYRETMRAVVTAKGGGLELRVCFKHEDRLVFLLPLSITSELSTFMAFSGGRQLRVEFRHSNHGISLLFERYQFRKAC